MCPYEQRILLIKLFILQKLDEINWRLREFRDATENSNVHSTHDGVFILLIKKGIYIWNIYFRYEIFIVW